MKVVHSALPLLIAFCAACGKGGGMDTGGGNLHEVREARIRQQLVRLKDDLLHVVGSLEPEQIGDPAARETYRALLDAGLATDIAASRYDVVSTCYREIDGKRTAVAASAGMNDRGGRICFSLPELVKTNASEREIYSLAIHEHSHHFGYGESAALAAGEALAGYFGAELFFHPRDPQDGSGATAVAADKVQSPCLDVSSFISRVRRMPTETRGWSSTTDVRISRVDLQDDEDDWFLALAHQYWFSAPEEFSAPDAFDMRSFYQDGCKQLIVEEDDFYGALEIVSYSPTHIQLRGSLTYNEGGLHQVGSTYSAPRGAGGDMLVLETESVVKAVKACEGEGDETEETRQTRRVTGRIEMSFGQSLPERIPLSVGLARLLDNGPRIEQFLAGRGCTIYLDE